MALRDELSEVFTSFYLIAFWEKASCRAGYRARTKIGVTARAEGIEAGLGGLQQERFLREGIGKEPRRTRSVA